MKDGWRVSYLRPRDMDGDDVHQLVRVEDGKIADHGVMVVGREWEKQLRLYWKEQLEALELPVIELVREEHLRELPVELDPRTGEPKQ